MEYSSAMCAMFDPVAGGQRMLCRQRDVGLVIEDRGFGQALRCGEGNVEPVLDDRHVVSAPFDEWHRFVLQTQAVFTVLFAGVLLRERPRGIQITGMAIALAGIAIIGFNFGQTSPIMTFLLCVGAAAMWGLRNVAMRKARPDDAFGFVPPFGLASAAIVLGESITAGNLLAAALIVGGVALGSVRVRVPRVARVGQTLARP